MFQFTNTIVLNTATDSSGKAKYVAHAATATKPAVFEVKRVNNFNAYVAGKGGVVAIYKRNASNGVLAQAKLTAVNWGPGIYQLEVRLTLSQYSQNSFYSRAIPVPKGKPLYYSFEITATDTAAQIATKVKKAVDYINQRFGDRWINVSTTGANITIDALDEYQRFYHVAIQKYMPSTDPCACNDVCNCEWVDQVVAQEADETGTFPDPNNTLVQGREGFGTYTQITKDLRLPTMANTNWLAVNQEERAVPGALYDQYVIQYVKPRGIQGTDAVGDLVISSTDHVFFVKQDLVAAWETALADVAAATSDGAIQVIDGPGTYPDPSPTIGL